jgi:hypothetical protein
MQFIMSVRPLRRYPVQRPIPFIRFARTKSTKWPIPFRQFPMAE